MELSADQTVATFNSTSPNLMTKICTLLVSQTCPGCGRRGGGQVLLKIAAEDSFAILVAERLLQVMLSL